MEANVNLNVQDILKTHHFKDAKVVAGSSGLNRIIKWVHIIEVKFLERMLNGNELVLSTGVGWEGGKHAIAFLQWLIEQNASGLCIELGKFFNQVPEEMIRLANEHHFPLIVFTKEVRFVDITHDIHALLINNGYRMFSDLEKFSKQMDHILLSPHDHEDILHFVQRYLNIYVIYLPLQGDALFFPTISLSEQKRILDLILGIKLNQSASDIFQMPLSNYTIACKMIKMLEHTWADLIFITNGRELTEFELLVLDRVTLMLARELLREFYIKEKKRHEEDVWIIDWLNGKLRDKEIEQHLKIVDPFQNPGCTVCLAKLNLQTTPNKSLKEFMIHITIVARSRFEQQGFHFLATFKQNQMIYVLLDNRDNRTWKIRVKKALERLKIAALGKNTGLNSIDVIFGIGKMIYKLTELYKSFQTAQESILIQQKTGKTAEPMYEDLHIYRIISLLDGHNDLHEFAMDYLEPLIKYDTQHNGELMQTLKVFLECNCCKQEAAKHLFISRQTMYNRIKKLEELLGEDFIYSEKRAAIELAIYTYNYLQLSISWKELT